MIGQETEEEAGRLRNEVANEPATVKTVYPRMGKEKTEVQDIHKKLTRFHPVKYFPSLLTSFIKHQRAKHG